MARGYSQSRSENPSLLKTPGPEIASTAKNIIAKSGDDVGSQFVAAMNWLNSMTADAKRGEQISLTGMSAVQSEMLRLKNEALTTGYNKPMSLLAEEMRNRLDVTPNGLALLATPTAYYSSYDKSDSSGQTYDQRIITEKGKKLEYATEAMKILRNAPEAFNRFKVADVENFVNDYVRMNLKGAAQEKFTGIKWNIRSYPD
jgi:hypothetical protein